MLRKLYNNALFHVGQHIRHGHVLGTVRALEHSRGAPRVLDAGSGGGGISFALATAMPQATVEGVELIPDKVEDCTARALELGVSNASFAAGDVTDIGRSGRYDLAVSVDVFEHVEDDAAAMRSVHDALVPGGTFVLHVPRDEPRRFLRRLEDHHQHDHVRDGYDPPELTESLRVAGFEIDAIRHTFGAAGELAWELMQVGMGIGGRTGDLFRIVLWPAMRFLCWLDVQAGGGARGNGILVIARRPLEDAQVGDKAVCA